MSDGARTMQDLTVAAEAGDRQAQFELGRRYFRGIEVERDAEAAAHWLQRAAIGGHLVARIYLQELTAETDAGHQGNGDASFERWLASAMRDLRRGEGRRRERLRIAPAESAVRRRSWTALIAAIGMLAAVIWWWRGGF
ncbi:MAG: sel1 repeat family protein [Alphaproteobacteria bacterium]|nr:sel1 repeat family protein [Alphaproteobacteria bacterium]